MIADLLPQKYPFVMVDTLVQYTNTTLHAAYTVPEGALFVQDGFFLEAGIVEHMAQSVALHTGYSYFLREEAAPTGYIGAINKVEISFLPKIGEVLESKVEILQEFLGITLVDIKTFVRGEFLASAQMKTVIAS
jgi:3-hydroxyacyl-[acyl-carrier-protein] dehydratase